MSPRYLVLSTTLALGLLAGCSRNGAPSPSMESGGTPSAEAQPPVEQPVNAPGESPSGGTDAVIERGPAVFFVKNSGVRCITHPCPSFVITRPDRPGQEPLKVHELDFAALNLDDEKRAQLELLTFQEPGLKVEASVDTVPNAGPAGAANVLRVSKVVEGK
jgi:hypothetical protein